MIFMPFVLDPNPKRAAVRLYNCCMVVALSTARVVSGVNL
jgi:hypothetical protein